MINAELQCKVNDVTTNFRKVQTNLLQSLKGVLELVELMFLATTDSIHKYITDVKKNKYKGDIQNHYLKTIRTKVLLYNKT